MKKLVLTLGLCLVAVVCFGQKKAVAEALKLAKDAKPNFVEARIKIKAALQHPETKDDPKTWFTAGQIENIQFDKENTKQFIGQQPAEAVMYNALVEIYPYFAKAYELDMKPDAKGKVKPKFAKDMKAITKVNLPHYINGGVYFFEQKNQKKAFEFFDQYVVISDSPLLKDGEPPTTAVDSNYLISTFYAAAMAFELDDHEKAIKAITRATKQEFNQNTAFQYLAQRYKDADDMVNYEKALAEGFALFPTEIYFIQNLMIIYTENEKNDKAIELTQIAIKHDPTNPDLYNFAGMIFESSLNDNAKAEENFLKAVELNPESAEFQFNLGRIYYNQAVEQLNVASEITDMKKYNEEREKARVLFRKSLPFLEKAYQLNSTMVSVMIPLRNIYYQLDMGAKYEEMDKLIGE